MKRLFYIPLSIGMALLAMPSSLFSMNTIHLGAPETDLYTFIGLGLNKYENEKKIAERKAREAAAQTRSKMDSSKTYHQLIIDLTRDMQAARKRYDDYANKLLPAGTLYIETEKNKREKAYQDVRRKLHEATTERDALIKKLFEESKEFDAWVKKNVEAACKKTNADLRKERAGIEKELTNFTLSTFAKQKKARDVLRKSTQQ
mgnify:CR=1 FL=1